MQDIKSVIQIGILDDHQIVIDGLKLLLNDQDDLQVVIESKNALQLLKNIKPNQVDLILTDIIMPEQMNGIEFTQLAKEKIPMLKILILSMNEEGKQIVQLIDEIKVEGYLSKEAGKEELIDAIKQVYEGKTYFSKSVMRHYNQYKEVISETKKLHLTNRELDIVRCIIKYYSNKQIATELYISERTVETHRKNIYRKTNTKGESSLIQFIKEKNIL